MSNSKGAVASSIVSAQTRRDESQKLFECPVCVQIYRNPKLLPCGHSICSECCNQLNRERIHLLCPVCRRPANVSAESLPINFGLRDLVQHHLDTLELKKFACVSCDQRISVGDCWHCQDCRSVICSQCALKNHKSHPLKEITEMLRDKEHELAEWREKLTKVDQDVSNVRRQVDVNHLRLAQCGQQLLQNTLWNKLTPQLDAESKSLKQELLTIQKRYRDVNAARLITDEATGRESDFVNLPTEYATLAEKQEKLLKRQNEALSALRKCDAALLALLAPSQRRCNPCSSLAFRYNSLASGGGGSGGCHNWRFFRPHHPPEVINIDAPVDQPDSFSNRHAASSAANNIFDDTSDDDTEPEVVPTRVRLPLNYLMDTSEPAGGGTMPTLAPMNHMSTLHIPQQRQASSDEENVTISDDNIPVNDFPVGNSRFFGTGRLFNIIGNRARRHANNGDRVITVDEDSLDEMDIAPSTSSADVHDLGSIPEGASGSAAVAGTSGGGGSKKTSSAPKRGRRTTTSVQATNGSDSSEEGEIEPRDDSVDSTIRFRILRKYDRNN